MCVQQSPSRTISMFPNEHLSSVLEMFPNLHENFLGSPFLSSVSTRLTEHRNGDMLSVTCSSPYICLNLPPFAFFMSRVKLIFGLEYLERNETIRQTQLIHFEMKSITIKYTQLAETANHYAITLFPIFPFESCFVYFCVLLHLSVCDAITLLFSYLSPEVGSIIE